MSAPRPPTRARIVFVGSGEFGRATLRWLANASGSATGPVELAGVVTAPPRARGRAREVAPTPIGALASDLGVPAVLVPPRLRDAAAVDAVLALTPDLLVVADYGQIVPRPLLTLRHGALNLHPSRLPRHRGASPIPATILDGDPDTAVTLIRMDEGIDTGPIVAVSEPVAIGLDETAPELEERLEAVAAELLRDVLPDWLAGAIEPVPQPTDGATLTRTLRREDGRLDPERPALLLERQVRAFRPWPGAFVEIAGGERLSVLRAGVEPAEPDDVPGRLVAHGSGLALTTADGRLRLDEVQPAGSRPMGGDAFVRGRRGFGDAGLAIADATMADR